jgi:hypothetical protein
MILSLINDGNTTLNVRSERTRQGRIPCKSNLFWENNIAKCTASGNMWIFLILPMVSYFMENIDNLKKFVGHTKKMSALVCLFFSKIFILEVRSLPCNLR